MGIGREAVGSGASPVVLIGAGRARIVVEDGAAMAMMPAAEHTYDLFTPNWGFPGPSSLEWEVRLSLRLLPLAAAQSRGASSAQTRPVPFPRPSARTTSPGVPRAHRWLSRDPPPIKALPRGGGPTRASRRAVVLASLRAVTWRRRSAPRLPASPPGPVSPRAATPPWAPGSRTPPVRPSPLPRCAAARVGPGRWAERCRPLCSQRWSSAAGLCPAGCRCRWACRGGPSATTTPWRTRRPWRRRPPTCAPTSCGSSPSSPSASTRSSPRYALHGTAGAAAVGRERLCALTEVCWASACSEGPLTNGAVCAQNLFQALTGCN